jgi:hypothetical protein
MTLRSRRGKTEFYNLVDELIKAYESLPFLAQMFIPVNVKTALDRLVAWCNGELERGS